MNIEPVDELNVFEILFCQNGKIRGRGLMTQTIDNYCLSSKEI
jgi:hypothetical protein